MCRQKLVVVKSSCVDDYLCVDVNLCGDENSSQKSREKLTCIQKFRPRQTWNTCALSFYVTKTVLVSPK